MGVVLGMVGAGLFAVAAFKWATGRTAWAIKQVNSGIKKEYSGFCAQAKPVPASGMLEQVPETLQILGGVDARRRGVPRHGDADPVAVPQHA